jgi:ATP/maltotriose-dependent transcriptional regulator MalT
MQTGGVNRLVQDHTVDDFLSSLSVPSALVIEGEPGIGKTTLWLAAIERARVEGFQVLSARAAAAESVLAYASLADLLAGVNLAGRGLPDLQRVALDRVLLRTDDTAPPTDQRAAGAGLLSVIEGLASEAPVLVAIDDVQWLDPSSMSAVAFAARRLSGRVGVLATVRDDPDSDRASWLQLPRPDSIHRIVVPPLSLGGLHGMILQRLGLSLARPTIVRIHKVSGGNPFYALELARAMSTGANGEMALSGSLSGLVRARIGGLAMDVQNALLAAACVAAPTVELVASATGTDAEEVARLLADAESEGIVEIDGERLRFAHPLLSHGVYTGATPAGRRAMHRRLAEILDEPELKARHLALAAVSGDPRTLQSLDSAADMAGVRGAPTAAAELLDLAIRLGGDTPQRRIRLASQHLAAGDLGRARKMLEETIESLSPGALRGEALSVFAGVCLFDAGFIEAVGLAKRALAEAGQSLDLRVQTLITLSLAQLNTGRFADALRSVEEAVTDARRLGLPRLLSQALGMQVMLRFMGGEGLDEAGLRLALELEDRHADMPVAFRPSMCHAQLLAWTGRLAEASQEMLAIGQRGVERGEESELVFITVHRFQIATWLGDFTEAALVAEDAVERARLLGGDFPLAAALSIQTVLAAFAGREDDARSYADEALAASQRCGAIMMVGWQMTARGFLEVSLGNYEAARAILQPLDAMVGRASDATEIITASYIPDAAEALISLGRLAEAEPLIDRLERNGRRLDRAWMLAVGGRCRALLLAANGEIDAATVTAQEAMEQHRRLPMPFERARTQLVLGQLQRRQRHKGEAAATLREALSAFEELDTRLWADRARAELARATLDLTRTAELTPSEQGVAELVASGMTNREVATAMFISPKTVEANLSRIYRKLGIRSRGELGAHIGQPDR